MAELTKQQLEAANAELFPNNNTGFITADKLRTFNVDVIESLVDEITYNANSASWNAQIAALDGESTELNEFSQSINEFTQSYYVASASFDARINVLDPSGSAQAIDSLQIATASLNDYTQSQNSFNSSATASIVALQGFSASLDATFATDAQLSSSVSALSASIAVTDLAQSQSIAALQQFSSSLDSGFVTEAELSASSSTLQNDINTRLLTSSFNTYTSSITTQFAGIGAALNTKLNNTTFNSYTQSNDSIVNGLSLQTSSYASATYVNNLSGAIAETDATQSVIIASLTAQTSSYATTTQLGEKLDTTAFNLYTQSVSQNVTQINSVVSASATTGSNTFIGNQIVSGNVNIAGNITAESASFIYLETIYQTSSVVYSSGSNILGDELSDVQTLSGSVKVEGNLTVNGVSVQTASFDASGYLLTSSFNQYTQSVSESVAQTTSTLLQTSTFNSYTESNDTKVNALINQTSSYAISSSVASALNELSSSVSLTYATETELSASASTLQNGINSKVETSTFNSYTQSQSGINTGLTQAIATRLTTASFNTYTQSNDSKVNSLISATGSYITSAQTSSMTVLSSSFAETASFALNVTPTDVTPFLSKSAFDTYTGSAALGVSESINVATQSLSSSIAGTDAAQLYTSSFNTYTASVNTQFAGVGAALNTKLNISTFNSYTQSNDSVVNALVSQTSSYASAGYVNGVSGAIAETDATQSQQIADLTSVTSSYATTGSNTFKDNQIISGNLDVTGKITALSASITYLETIYQTSSVVYSSGSNILGDELSDVQTLSGSVEVEGTLKVNGVSVALDGTQYTTTSSFNSYTSSQSGINTGLSEGIASRLLTSSFNTYTASIATQFIGIGSALNTKLAITDFNSYTSSNDGKVNSLISQTSSYAAASYVNSLSGAIAETDFTQSEQIASLTANTSSYISSAQTASMSVLTASFAVTAAYAENVTPTDVSMFVSESTFNTYTSSQSSINSGLTSAIAGKVSLNSVAQTITGSLLVSGNFDAIVQPAALSIGATNVNTVIETTASGVPSTLDVIRIGAGPTGDLSGVRLQTLSGSDTSGDTLLSRISTNVNRHTSTAMTGSVVNTIITSQWATGSGVTRVAYTSNVIANAQSASATLTLQAGTGATLAGGTASLAAGFIKIGTDSSNRIEVTGSARITGNTIITGSLNVVGAIVISSISSSIGIAITGSVNGQQLAGDIASSTASFDCSKGNFFTLVLGGGSNHLTATNIRPGQTINVRVTTQSGNSVTCSSAIKQPSGSLYTPTDATGTDILTFISYDSTLYMVSAKNFI
jgi:hypothetical protein